VAKKFKKPTAMLNHREHPNVSLHDWRLHAVTSMTKPAIVFGQLYDVGTVVKAAGPIRMAKGGTTLNLGAPSVTAMFLDMSAILDEQEKHLHAEVIGMCSRPVTPSDENRVLNGIEKRMASVVFAFTALESFANEIIEEAYGVRGFRYEPVQKDGLSASYDLEHVEYRLQLDEKLGVIVPEALSIKSPKGRTEWNQFVRLKDLRNRIIHYKGRDRGPSQDKTLWRELLSDKSSNFALQAYALVAFYYEQIPSGPVPRWFCRYPYVPPGTEAPRHNR
jgi:hypothetical protein